VAFVVGIAGGSCSGKTTLAHALIEYFEAEQGVNATLLMQDSYYADLTGMTKAERDRVNFDHPSALDFDLMRDQLARLKNGAAIDCPVYDFSQHHRCSNTETIHAADIVIVEGTLVLEQAILHPLFDLSVFVHAEETLRLARRIQRDVEHRGRTEAFAQAQFHETVAPMHNAFVEPSRTHANILIDGSKPTQHALNEVLLHIPPSLR
jgi:uridine kinase